LEQFPQLIRHQPLNDRNHDRQPTDPNEMASKNDADDTHPSPLMGIPEIGSGRTFVNDLE
ncbi:hypothetical protein, partial [Streptomyces sp. NPDC001340]